MLHRPFLDVLDDAVHAVRQLSLLAEKDVHVAARVFHILVGGLLVLELLVVQVVDLKSYIVELVFNLLGSPKAVQFLLHVLALRAQVSLLRLQLPPL